MDVLAASGGFLELLLGNGDGTLQQQTPIFFGYLISANSLAVADFNGDSHLDVAAFDINGNLQVFLGAGNGTFANPIVTYAGSAPTNLVTADFNNDGIADLALVHQYYGTLDFLPGNGDGTFGSPIVSSIDPLTSKVTIADLNLDGKPDLLLLAPADTAGYLYALLGNGQGGFSSGAPNIVGPNPSQV